MRSSDDALNALVARGFRCLRSDDSLVFTFAWEEPFIDVVHVRAEDDVTAVRSAADGGNPNLFALENVVWSACGRGLVEVVTELFEVPNPGEPGAPSRRVQSHGSPGNVGREWFPGR
ncbi:hypothetical protein SAMN05216174_1043 [Actinokineospora iranica]|uniref:Uncharacterized protein n=1 Tax=Actinokineospora iranica TaxID=1271860 RepID=A0A1G6NY16_9PSEU|nr:hypothetical protein SAMN05216174_1043 [Actinokineospora iranica]